MAAKVNSHWLPLSGLMGDPLGEFVGKGVKSFLPDVTKPLCEKQCGSLYGKIEMCLL